MECKIIDIEEGLPHTLAELICIGCHERSMSIWPSSTKLKTLECSNCGETGLMIMTGQFLDE